MKVSVITATYNSHPTILDTIECIRKQGYANIEYIVVDGGSNDQTVEVIRDSKVIAKSVSEPDKGIYDALNKGIRMASGDVIGFVHSDDLLAQSEILENISQTFQKEEIDGVYGDLVYVDKEDTDKVVRYWKSQPFQPKLLKRGWMPAHPTLYLKKHVYEKHGMFDLDFKIAADYDFMLRVLQDSELKFAYLPEVITKMRLGGASNRNLKNIIQKSKEDFRALKKNGIPYPAYALFVKNLSKLTQFFVPEMQPEEEEATEKQEMLQTY